MLKGFEIAVLWVLHFAGLTFETKSFEYQTGECRVFRVQVSSLEETWAWAKRICALARIHCLDERLNVSLNLENGLGEQEEIWLRRWNHHSCFSKEWEETDYELGESFVWVNASTGVSYSIYFKVK